MSVLIKGMEMPKSCDMCWALDDFGDYPRCRITEEQRGYNFPVREQRMGKCHLVPVPPHGDLIDSCELFKEMERKGWHDNADRDIAEDLVLAAPIVIPADVPDTNVGIIPAEEGEG